jgi:parallel beta-helix repeat protein
MHSVQRTVVSGLSWLTLATSAIAADRYATPSGSGAHDGSSWANAWPQAQIQAAVDKLAAGDTLNLGSGTYSLPSLTISSSGTAGNLKQIVGVETENGGGLPLFQGTHVAASDRGGAFLTISSSGAHYWAIKNIQIRNFRFGVDMAASGTTDALYTNILLEHIAMDTVQDGFRLCNCSYITVKNCSVIRHTKKGFRYGEYSAYVSFVNCRTDCNGGDDSFPAQRIPNGFYGADTKGAAIIHDITFTDCISRNNRFATTLTYWNGDAFSTEKGTYNVTYTRCAGFDNHDAAFDNKANNVTLVDCVASGNKRGFRIWGSGYTMRNCLAVNSHSWGDRMDALGIWISKERASAEVYNCTFHNNQTYQLYTEGGRLDVYDSILSTTDATEKLTGGSTITLTRVTSYVPGGSDADPRFVAPAKNWTGSPANAFDSQAYGAEKGYSSTSVQRSAASSR